MRDTPRTDRTPHRPAPTPAGRTAPRSVERPIHLTLHRDADRAAPIAAPRPALAARRAVRPSTEQELAIRFFPVALLVAGLGIAVPALTGGSLAASASAVWSEAAWLSRHATPGQFTATGVMVGLLIMLAPAVCQRHPSAWVGLALIAGGGLAAMARLAEGSGVLWLVSPGAPAQGAADAYVALALACGGVALALAMRTPRAAAPLGVSARGARPR